MPTRQIKSLLLVCLSAISNILIAQSGADDRGAPKRSDTVGIFKSEIDFISDTQQPMALEEVRLRPNHNIKATSRLLADMLEQKPLAIFMLGDVVAVGSSNRKWYAMDRFIDNCRKHNIAVHGLLGNHDLMWSRRKGELNFQHRFPDHVNTGYISIVDSMAIVMLNSNFQKLSTDEIDKQQRWYKKTLSDLDSNSAIKTIIVTCHHSPYSNSRIVGSSAQVKHYFLPVFMQTAKCRIFITGHAHAFEYFTHGGKNFLVIGGGGGLHQPLDTSAKRIDDIAFGYKPMFHYLSVQRKGDKLLVVSRFLKPDFSGVGKGYCFEIGLTGG